VAGDEAESRQKERKTSVRQAWFQSGSKVKVEHRAIHRSTARATSTIVILSFLLQKCATSLPIHLLHNYVNNIKILRTFVLNKISSYLQTKKIRRDIHGVHILAVHLSLYRIFGLQQADVPRISKQSAHEGGKVVMPYAPPLPPANIPGTHFCWRMSRLQGHGAARGIKSMKNPNDNTGNRTRNLSACSAVPQPTAPPRTFILEVPHTVHQQKNENIIPNGLRSSESSESRKPAFRDSWSSPYQLNICQKMSVVTPDITLSKKVFHKIVCFQV